MQRGSYRFVSGGKGDVFEAEVQGGGLVYENHFMISQCEERRFCILLRYVSSFIAKSKYRSCKRYP